MTSYANDQPLQGSSLMQDYTTANRRTPTAKRTDLGRQAPSNRTAPQQSAQARPQTTASKKKKKKRRSRRLMLFSVLFLLFAVLVLISVIVGISCSSCDRGAACAPGITDGPDGTPDPLIGSSEITKNVTLNGISLKGMTVEAAREAVRQQVEQQLSAVSMTVQYEDLSLTLAAADMGLTYDVDAALSSLLEGANGAEATVPVVYTEETLRNSLYQLNEQIPNHAKNATATVLYESYQIEGKTYHKPYFSYGEGTNGMQIDYHSVLSQIRTALDNGQNVVTITPEVTISEPAVTAADLKNRTTLLASYSTTYRFKKTSSMTLEETQNAEARDANISKAIAMMQCIELRSGEQFSFNNATGKRSAENGWAEAKAVYQGSYRKETGGGVCQITTTMFNALLRANVQIDVRSGHSIPSDYVTAHFEDGLGFDATVDYGNKDFRFSNQSGNTIYIFCYITKNAESGRKKDIHIEVYGTAFEEGTEYRCRNEILEMVEATDDLAEYIQDDKMPATDEPILEREPHPYYKVMTYVDKYVNGVFVETVRTEMTEYDLIVPKYRVGTAIITAPPTNPPPSTPGIVEEDPSEGDDDDDDDGGGIFIPGE